MRGRGSPLRTPPALRLAHQAPLGTHGEIAALSEEHLARVLELSPRSWPLTLRPHPRQSLSHCGQEGGHTVAWSRHSEPTPVIASGQGSHRSLLEGLINPILQMRKLRHKGSVVGLRLSRESWSSAHEPARPCPRGPELSRCGYQESRQPREPEAVPHSCASGAVVTTKADLTPCSPFLTQAQGPGKGSLELWLSWWRADP